MTLLAGACNPAFVILQLHIGLGGFAAIQLWNVASHPLCQGVGQPLAVAPV